MATYRTLTVAHLILFAAAATAGGGPESKRPLREAESANKRFQLEIDAGRPGRADRACKATLTERAGDGRAVKRWERPLVNDAAPVKAFIRDDGRFVVTLDEFRRGGARNAVVIYGERGQLLRHFLLTDLLGKSDWRNVRASKRAVEWLEGSRSSFVAEPEQFLIELKWGREVRIDLKTLRLVNPPRDAGGDEEIPAEILAQLSDEHVGPPDEEELRRLAEQLGAQPDEIAKLLESGELDPATLEAALANVEEQRKHHAEELMLRQVLESAQAELANAPDDQTRAAIQAKIDEVRARLDLVAAQRAELGGELVLAEAVVETDPPAAPGADGKVNTGIAVPPPNPAEKVDYVAWLNSVTQIEGPSAVADFSAAVEKFSKYEGDADLFDAAMRGDPAAFNSPEFQAWLNSNREALQSFRRGAHLPFAGFPAYSQGGDMIGILLPNLSPMRGLSRLAVAESRRQIANGDPHAAVGTLTDTLAAGANTGNGPTLIENLVGVAMQALASQELMDVMAKHGGELDYTQVASAVESSYRPVRSMEESIQFERAMFMDSIQRIFTADPETGRIEPDVQKIREFQSLAGGDMDPVDNVMQTMGLATIDYDATLNEANALYDRMAAAARQPYREGHEQFSAIEREIAQSGNAMVKMLAPAFSRAHMVKTRAEAQRRASMLLANIKAYEQQTGAPPESLEAFAGREFVQDPFTGQPYIYRRTADGFMLYSAGGNGVDDGGIDDPKAETNDAVYWPRPPRP